MSVGVSRGGIPYVIRDVVTTGVAPAGGRKIRLPFFINWLKVRASVNPCRIYFTEADFLEAGGTNYVVAPVAAAETPYGEWEGPVETCLSGNSDIWVRGDGGSSTIELVAFQRRG